MGKVGFSGMNRAWLWVTLEEFGEFLRGTAIDF
jgi:hypothetical protein